MMVTLDKIKTAACSFAETEVMPKLPSGKKFAFGVVVIMLPHIIDNKFEEYSHYIEMLGFGDENAIDIDKVEQELIRTMDKYGHYQMDLLGTSIILKQEDLHKISNKAKTL